MLRYSPPASARGYTTVTETEHKKFHAEIVALGDKAVALATKKGTAGDVLTKYRALSGAARSAFYAKNSLALFAALNAAR
jgi:hypothetical protein